MRNHHFFRYRSRSKFFISVSTFYTQKGLLKPFFAFSPILEDNRAYIPYSADNNRHCQTALHAILLNGRDIRLCKKQIAADALRIAGIIQCVELGSPEGMVAFCKGIQSAAAVDSYVDPVPAPMPGYDSDVIMAAGAFVQGSSIELSADGPVREPYAVYYQGGLTWSHAKLGVLLSLQKMLDAGLITLP